MFPVCFPNLPPESWSWHAGILELARRNPGVGSRNTLAGIIGRGQNSGFLVHSAVKNGEKFAVKVSTENEEEGSVVELWGQWKSGATTTWMSRWKGYFT